MGGVIKIADIPKRFPWIGYRQLSHYRKKNIANFNSLFFNVDGETCCYITSFAKWFKSLKIANKRLDNKIERVAEFYNGDDLMAEHNIEYRMDVNKIISQIKTNDIVKVNDGW